MPRAAETPTPAELDDLAEITREDEARALHVWDRISHLPGLLRATRNDDAGGVSDPMPDGDA